MCQSSPTNRLVPQYSYGSPLRWHIKGCMHYISYCRYSDMKSVEYTHIQFGQLFTIGFALTYFDKNITCVNQVPHTGFSPNTCMVVP